MRQISQNYRTGEIRLEEVSLPLLKRGGVLVQTHYSVISTGTEGMKAREGKMSYVGKAKARPDQVKKVLQSVQQQGVAATYQKVMNRLDSLTPLGYSLAGTVVAVGAGADEFTVGQRVACAGAGYANHAEINFVPKNLVVPVPEGVAMEHAAFTTIGAIAMQGFRQAEMQLGETACVIGLGLLGQLLVQLLRAAGIQVIGIDLIEERCRLAERFGAGGALRPDEPGLLLAINRLTGGIGVDCTLIAAGGESNGPAELAVEIARDRGRIVDIGKTRLDLPWNACYEKELDLRFSRSYGPGRYDTNYEERGIDYPVGYVRWTERRNMQAFLKLVSERRVDLAPVIAGIRPFSEAETVYEELSEGKLSGLGVVFCHAQGVDQVRRLPLPPREAARVRKGVEGSAQIGLIGAGNYASTMLLPHLAANPGVCLREVATATSLSARNAARKFKFERYGTDHRALLAAPDVDAVIIATHHATHAPMVAEALRAGKAVHVEKPLAIDLEGLMEVWTAVRESRNERVMVGFNRRFAPLVREAAAYFRRRSGPLAMSYRVHAGRLDHGSWYLDSAEQGSRFVGEAGHFLDLFAYFTGARPVSVMARALRPAQSAADDQENLSVLVEYNDGSVGTLLYLTQGGAKVPKELLEVFGEGRTVQLHNFECLRIFEGSRERKRSIGAVDKGQKDEMAEFVTAVRLGRTPPITLECLFDTTLVTLGAAESMRRGVPVYLADYWEALDGGPPRAQGSSTL